MKPSIALLLFNLSDASRCFTAGMEQATPARPTIPVNRRRQKVSTLGRWGAAETVTGRACARRGPPFARAGPAFGRPGLRYARHGKPERPPRPKGTAPVGGAAADPPERSEGPG